MSGSSLRVGFDNFDGYDLKHFGARVPECRDNPSWFATEGRDLGYIDKMNTNVRVFIKVDATLGYVFHSSYKTTREAEKAVRALFANSSNLYAFYEARREAAFAAIRRLYN